MKADSRIFGKIEIEDDKIITLEKGMIGFRISIICTDL